VQAPSLPATSHASHWPSQALVQQTPSTHSPDEHSATVLQPEPASFFSAHTPPAQYSSLLQLASLVQELTAPAQADPMHAAPFGQSRSSDAGHLPDPLQNDGKVARLPSHLASWHTVPGPG
jgi:hypothetical protein